MRSVFGHYVRMDSFWLALADISIIFLVLASVSVSPLIGDANLLVLKDFVYLVALPTCFMGLVLFSLGVYEPASFHTPSLLVQRLIISVVLGGVGILAIFHQVLHQGPAIVLAVVAMSISFLLISLLRLMIQRGLLPTTLKPQILVLGVGSKAEMLCKLVKNSREVVVRGFVHVEPYSVEVGKEIPQDLLVPRLNSICDYVVQNGITRIVLALDERRAALPMQELLTCRLQGVEVIDCATFFEREGRKVDVENLYPSWLIFSDGFKRDVLTISLKRVLDVILSTGFLIMVFPLAIFTMIAIRLESPGPVIYRQRRVGLNGRTFQILKFRSMTVDAEKGRQGALGPAQRSAHHQGRILYPQDADRRDSPGDQRAARRNELRRAASGASRSGAAAFGGDQVL